MLKEEKYFHYMFTFAKMLSSVDLMFSFSVFIAASSLKSEKEMY